MDAKTCLNLIVASGFLITGLGGTGVEAATIQGSGKVISQARKVPAFHGIRLNLPAELTADVGSAGDVVVESDDNLLPHITTRVEAGDLVIDSDASLNNPKKIAIRIKSATLDHLSISGAANATIHKLAGSDFKLNAQGASNTTLEGKVQALSATLSGAGKLQATNLVAQRVKLSTAGAASAEVNATQQLDVSISGVGSVKYKGDPKVTKNIAGLGTVEKM